MKTKYFAAALAAFSATALTMPASAVTINSSKCVSVTDVAGCFYTGNMGNAGDAAAAQSQYNAIRNPDILLTFLGKSDAGFGSLTFTDSTNTGGTWSTPGYLVDFIAVKAGPEFILYQLAAPASSGSWSTAGLVNARGIKKELSHLTFFGSAGAVPEPATWGMMIAGFGLVGASLRRRKAVRAFA